MLDLPARGFARFLEIPTSMVMDASSSSPMVDVLRASVVTGDLHRATARFGGSLMTRHHRICNGFLLRSMMFNASKLVSSSMNVELILKLGLTFIVIKLSVHRNGFTLVVDLSSSSSSTGYINVLSHPLFSYVHQTFSSSYLT